MKFEVNEYIKVLSEKFKFHPTIVKRIAFWFGYKETIDILDSLKKPTSKYTLRVNTLKIEPDDVVRILRSKGINAKKHDKLPEMILIPVKGPNKIPTADKKVIAYKSAAEGVMRGADLYATGVRSVDESIKKGDIVEIVDKFHQKVAIGEALVDAKEMLKREKGKIVVRITKSLYEIPKFRDDMLYKEGLIFQQTIPSALTVKVLDPKPGEKILDMCAAPGGKASFISQITNEKAKLFAVDHSKKKINEMKKTFLRLGIKRNVTFVREDSRKLLEHFGEEKFDKILLDPPCSALGIRPKLFDGIREKDLINNVKYQRQFLKVAAKLIKVNGVIIYSTCTIDPDENEKNIAYIQSVANGKIIVEEQNIILGTKGYPIIKNAELLQRFYPHTHDTPGYFIAKLKRIG
ncbi:MAG: PUA domain-containing protein [Candidatus Asgardarchaeia archaeon]